MRKKRAVIVINTYKEEAQLIAADVKRFLENESWTADFLEFSGPCSKSFLFLWIREVEIRILTKCEIYRSQINSKIEPARHEVIRERIERNYLAMFDARYVGLWHAKPSCNG